MFRGLIAAAMGVWAYWASTEIQLLKESRHRTTTKIVRIEGLLDSSGLEEVAPKDVKAEVINLQKGIDQIGKDVATIKSAFE